METETMKRHIQADSRINASGISHKSIVAERDNCIASPIIDAEKRTFAIVRQKLSKERRTAPIIVAKEDTGVILS